MNNISNLAVFGALLVLIFLFMRDSWLQGKGKLTGNKEIEANTSLKLIVLTSVVLLLCGIMMWDKNIRSQNQYVCCTDKAEASAIPQNKPDKKTTVTADTIAKPKSADTTVANKKKVAVAPDPKKKPKGKVETKKRKPSKPAIRWEQARGTNKRTNEYVDPKNPPTSDKRDY
jgi:hypothetical protein